MTVDAQARDRLAAMFWPAADPERSRGAFAGRSQRFTPARPGPGPDGGSAHRDQLDGLNVDVADFHRAIAESRFAEAAALLRGDFLAGFSLRESADFDEWQTAQAEALRREAAWTSRYPRVIKLVCWDLDGTLTDSVRVIADCANEIIRRRGGRELAFAEVAELTGLPLEDIFRLAFDGPSDELLLACRDEYRAHYTAVLLPRTKLHPGASEALRALTDAGIRQATVTGKRARDCELILRNLGVGERFDLFLGGDSVPRPKPAPDLVLLAARTLGIPLADTLVVGDTRVDMEMGKAAGARTCLVLWGVRSEPTGLEDHVARSFDDVRRIVEATQYTRA